MKNIDADDVTPAELARAIGNAVHSGETLTISRGGKVRSQVVTPKGPPPCCCAVRYVGAICLDCDGSVDHLLPASANEGTPPGGGNG